MLRMMGWSCMNSRQVASMSWIIAGVDKTFTGRCAGDMSSVTRCSADAASPSTIESLIAENLEAALLAMPGERPTGSDADVSCDDGSTRTPMWGRAR